MRLIDADRLQKQFNEKSTNPNYRVNMHNIKSIITNAPTVEAIPKADYEERLKADMVDMLEELKKSIEDKVYNVSAYSECLDCDVIDYEDVNEIIIEKINSLKEGKDETDKSNQ